MTDALYSLIRKYSTEDFTEDSSFSDLGLDSLDRVELVIDCERTFGIEMTDDQIEEMNTVSDLSLMIEKLRTL